MVIAESILMLRSIGMPHFPGWSIYAKTIILYNKINWQIMPGCIMITLTKDTSVLCHIANKTPHLNPSHSC